MIPVPCRCCGRQHDTTACPPPSGRTDIPEVPPLHGVRIFPSAYLADGQRIPFSPDTFIVSQAEYDRIVATARVR